MCGNRSGIERPGRVYLPGESEMGASRKIKINEPTEICSCQILQNLSHQKDSASSTYKQFCLYNIEKFQTWNPQPEICDENVLR